MSLIYIIKNNLLISIDNYDIEKKNEPIIGYFEFLSHDSIQWHKETSGFVFYPYLYIIDDENIRIEIFYYFTGGEMPRTGSSVSAGKYYINITKAELISRYLRRNNTIRSYIDTWEFEIHKYQPESLNFNILYNTNVYSDGSMTGERINSISRGTSVEVIDLYYNDLFDRLPAALRIKTNNLTGWININSINFINQEIVYNQNVNGTRLHNSVRATIDMFGARSLSGRIVGNFIPVKALPANNSQQLFQLWNNDKVDILEVSENREIINGIEAAWYKIYRYVEKYTQDMTPIDYEVEGWIFGGSLEANEFINERY
ncbi:MAG: hypothetical protein FWC01_01035 [Treponema sp.]|nr:hypothetical protein [Treponema sp.]